MSLSWNLGGFLNNPYYNGQSSSSASSSTSDATEGGETLAEAYAPQGFSFSTLRTNFSNQADFYGQDEQEWEDTHGAITVGDGDAGVTTLDDADQGDDDGGGSSLDIQA